MIARQFYPLVLTGYHLGLAIASIAVGSIASKKIGLTDDRSRAAGICTCLTHIEAVAQFPMVAFVNSYVRIRDEGLNFLVMHTVLVAALVVVGCALSLGAQRFRAQMIAINLLSIPFVLVAWLSC